MILKHEEKVAQTLNITNFLFGIEKSRTLWGEADVLLLDSGHSISRLYSVLSAERTGSWDALFVIYVYARERARNS